VQSRRGGVRFRWLVCRGSADGCGRLGRARLRGRVGVATRRILGRLVLAAAGIAFDVEEIADPLERPDPARLARLRAELPADTADPDPEVLEIVAILRAPD